MISPAVKKWGSRVFLLLGVALAVYTVTRFPLSDIGKVSRALGIGVVLTPLICLWWYWAAARGLWYLLDREVPILVLFWNRVVGEGYNILVPAAGVGGEPVKLAQLSRYVDTQRAVIALINDRLIQNAIGLVYSAVFVGIAPLVMSVSSAMATSMYLYGIGAAIAGIAMGAVMFTNVTGRIGSRLARWLGAEALSTGQLPLPILWRTALWNSIGRAIGFIEVVVLFWLLDCPVTWWNVLFMNAALAAAGFVGGIVPQNAGVAEATTVGVFEMLHLPGPAGVAFALARRGRMLVTSVLGVGIHLAFGRKVAQLETARIADRANG